MLTGSPRRGSFTRGVLYTFVVDTCCIKSSGLHVVYTWLIRGLHVVYTRFIRGLYVVYTWFTRGLHTRASDVGGARFKTDDD